MRPNFGARDVALHAKENFICTIGAGKDDIID